MNGRELRPGVWCWYLGLKSIFLDRPYTCQIAEWVGRGMELLMQTGHSKCSS